MFSVMEARRDNFGIAELSPVWAMTASSFRVESGAFGSTGKSEFGALEVSKGKWKQDAGAKTMNKLVRYLTKLSLAGVVAVILTLGPAQAFHKGIVHGGGGDGADVKTDWNNLV